MATNTTVPAPFVATFNRNFVPNIKANTSEAKTLYTSISRARPGFAKRFLADPEKNIGLLKQLVSETAPHYQIRDGTAGKGKGKGKGKGALPRHAPAYANNMPFARRNAKGSGKGNVPFADQRLPECFCLHQGEQVAISDPLSVEGGEQGVALVSHAVAMRIAKSQTHRMPFEQ